MNILPKNSYYMSNKNLKKSDVNIEFTKEQIEEYVKCSKDPLYFINNYVMIINVDDGLVPFNTRPYQDRMLDAFFKERFVLCKLPRQSGKSTIVTAFMLWCVLFKEHQVIALLANKESLAIKQLDRIKLAYEHLPKWLQQGVVEWSKKTIELENGSSIEAHPTSSSSIRGGSYNCIGGDSLIDIRISGEEFTIKIEDLTVCIANSSKKINIINNGTEVLFEKDGIDVFREQVQTVARCDNRTQKGNPTKGNNDDGKSSHNSTMSGWGGYSRELCYADNKGTYADPPAVDKNGKNRSTEKKNAIRILSNGEWEAGASTEHEVGRTNPLYGGTIRTSEKISNREEAYRGNKTEDILSTQRYHTNRIFKKEAIFIYDGEEFGCEETNWVWGEDIQSNDGETKDHRAYGENKQESRKNKKDSRGTSRDETIRRVAKKDVRSSQGKGSLEQGVEIKTAAGWKSFDGVKVTEQQDTLSVTHINGSIECTKDHLIMTRHGWKEARECLGEDICVGDSFYLCSSITEARAQDVYDVLNVKDVNSFYANGILVHNCIFLDEFAHVDTNLAEEFFASTYPTISSGKTTQVIIVSTPKGMNHFYKMWVNAEEKRNSYVALEVHWTEVPNYDEKWKAETIANIGEESFDQEYECSFLGSNHTLITSSKLRNIAWRVPKYSKNGLDIFHDPAIGHEYVTVVDTSEGVGLDYSAFTVIDVTEVPYRVVAKYRKNDISSLMYPEVVYNVATKYNHSFVLVETNSIGQQVADILHHDLEYEHVIMTAKRGRAGQQIGDFGGKSTPGIKTSVQVKKIGCANLKTLIESEKLIIEDFDIVFELSNFVRKRQSYSADDGHNDDLVMTLVLFGWLARQDYFKEMTNTDFRKRMLDENKQAIEEDMLPFGLLDDGRDETIPNEEVVEFGDDFGGNFWQESDNDYW